MLRGAAIHHSPVVGAVDGVHVPRRGRSAEAWKGPRRAPVALSWPVQCLVQWMGREDDQSESKDLRGVDRSEKGGTARRMAVSVRRTDPGGRAARYPGKAQRGHERTREQARTRQRQEHRSGVPCAARRAPSTPIRVYPPRCARVSRRPPTRDVPSRSQPAHHPACVRTHVNARARACPRNELPRLARYNPPRSRASVSRSRVHFAAVHLSGVVGRKGDPPPHLPLRTCVRSSHRGGASNDRVRLLGVGPPRLSKPAVRAPRYRA